MYVVKKTFGKIFKHNMCCCTAVSDGTVGLKRQFGRHVARMNPGCHCAPWCLGYTVAGFVSSRTRQIEVQSPLLTADYVPIEFRALVTWTLGNEQNAERNIPTRCEAELVSKVAIQSISRHIGRTRLDQLLTGLAWVANGDAAATLINCVRAEMQEILLQHGISLTNVFVFDIIPNAMLNKSYTELSAAQPTIRRDKLMMTGAKQIYKVLQTLRLEIF